MQATRQRPGVAATRTNYSAAQWLLVCVLDRALSDLFGIDCDEQAAGYYRIDAALYFLGSEYRWHCESLGVDPDAFLMHSGALEHIVNMVQ